MTLPYDYMTLTVGSKDLTQAVSQRQQGSRPNCQSPSHLGNHSDSNTDAHVKQQSSHAFGNESAHCEEEGQGTLTNCHSSSNDGTTAPMGGTACPSATAAAPSALENSLQVEDTQHKTQASSVIFPDASLQTSSSADQEQDFRSSRDQKKTCELPYVLFAIDGTWQEAKEIYKV